VGIHGAVRSKTHPQNAWGEKIFTSKDYSTAYENRAFFSRNPHVHSKSRPHVTQRCSTPFLGTASFKRMPNMHRTWVLIHERYYPTIWRSEEALPRLLTTSDHLIACLDLLLPLTCMMPSLSRDQLAVPWLLLCIKALDMHVIWDPSATNAAQG
jgi:hypothetical protein